MQDIYTILSGIGFTVPEDKKADFIKALRENYKTVDEVAKIEHARDGYKEQFEGVTEQLKAFEGVDVGDLREQIKTLNQTIEKNDQAHREQIADMEFNSTLEGAVRNRKAKNIKAVIAQLDTDTLKKSKNQSADIESALDAVEKSDAYLFDSGKTTPQVTFPGSPAPTQSDAKAYMDDFYKGNPYYNK